MSGDERERLLVAQLHEKQETSAAGWAFFIGMFCGALLGVCAVSIALLRG